MAVAPLLKHMTLARSCMASCGWPVVALQATLCSCRTTGLTSLGAPRIPGQWKLASRTSSGSKYVFATANLTHVNVPAAKLCIRKPINSSAPFADTEVASSPSSRAKTVVDVWTEVETWVVFSDLHLSRRTYDTCLQVLRTVHAEACARKAGIVFLGDFWHARGALPVELLNMAVMELQMWDCPAIFIPGNHDQVNLGGEVHALQVLEAANPYIKVLSSPVEYLGALWLPFRRDYTLIAQALQQHGTVQAIFAHVDVVGAFMNEAFQAKGGLDPSVFPAHLPVYTGHYHKPHVVEGTQIEYVGSPYQVSIGESDQAKHFLLLDKHWQKIGEIPVDIGPRHLIVSQNEGLPLEVVRNVRVGDRVRWHLSSNTLDDSSKGHLEELQRRGVLVDLVYPIVTSRQRIKEAEHLDAFGLFGLYAKSVTMNEKVTKMAVDMLRSLNLPAKLIRRPLVHLKLEGIEMEGFGVFLEPVKYPLAERGVRIVSGQNLDSSGADSNGAGKTTLVMAPLWALTGSTDARPDSVRGLTAAEVVHHNAKCARVRVDGTINGTPFTVERVAGRKSGLKFVVDGEDKTCQEIRMTQQCIDEFIGTSVLHRTVFHGQYGAGGLLEASDKDFKEELSKFMVMEVWVAAREHSMKVLCMKRTEVERLEGAVQQLAQQHQQLKMKVDECMCCSHEWERRRGEQVATNEAELCDAELKLQGAIATCSQLHAKVAAALCSWELLGKRLEQALQDGMEAWTAPKRQAGTVKTGNAELLETLLERTAQMSDKVKNAEADVGKRREMLEAFKMNVAGSLLCENCLQPIDANHASQSLLQLEADLTTSRDQRQLFLEEHKNSEEELKRVRRGIAEENAKLAKAQDAFKQTSVKLLSHLNRIRQGVTSAQMVLNAASKFLSSASWQASTADFPVTEDSLSPNNSNENIRDLSSEEMDAREGDLRYLIQQLEGKVLSGKTCKTTVEQLRIKCTMVKNNENPYEAEFKVISRLYATLQADILENESLLKLSLEEAGWLKEIHTSFGLTGVQSYILEGALAEVQERTARYLESLSGGSLELLLKPTKIIKSSKVSVEAIDKIAVVHLSNGTLEHRALRQLSGGERRRLSLALALGYAEFASQRGGVDCNLLVLDEVLQHLDGEGQARVVAVLKGLPHSTVLVVSQAHSLLAGTFDFIDWVVKHRDRATIETAEESML